MVSVDSPSDLILFQKEPTKHLEASHHKLNSSPPGDRAVETVFTHTNA